MIRGKALKNTYAVLFWLILWWLIALFVNRNLLIPIPTPLSTAKALVRLVGSSSFWLATGGSLLRISIGFVAALILGTVCAFISSRLEWFRTLTAPFLQLIRSIPVASFTILVFLWISRNRIPTVISFFTVFPIVWANVESGAMAADISLVEMGHVYGMKSREILRKILLPGIRPFFASAARSGLGFAWKSGVAAEVICRTADSLGNWLWISKNAIDYDEVFAITIVIVVLSTLLQKLAKHLMKGETAYDQI